METNFTQQEILLNKGAKFLANDWCLKQAPDPNANNNRTSSEKLEEACWNGLLKNIIPELFSLENDTSKLTLWKVRQMSAFIELELADYPAATDRYFSINPYLFLTAEECN
jgi:hypothetical protein